MGQRLNIQIEANDTDTNETKVLANCYYHWRGFTSSAMELVYEMVSSGIYNLDISDPVEKAIRLLEETGAGLPKDEFTAEYTEDKYKIATHRNLGLIAISEKGIKETMVWEESRVTINLTTGSIDMSDMFYDVTDEFAAPIYETKVKSIYKLKADLISSFDTFHDLYAELKDNVLDISDGCCMFVQKDCIYRTIE